MVLKLQIISLASVYRRLLYSLWMVLMFRSNGFSVQDWVLDLCSGGDSSLRATKACRTERKVTMVEAAVGGGKSEGLERLKLLSKVEGYRKVGLLWWFWSDFRSRYSLFPGSRFYRVKIWEQGYLPHTTRCGIIPGYWVRSWYNWPLAEFAAYTISHL